MEKITTCLLMLLVIQNVFSQNIGIGTPTPHASARLDITSTNSGFLPPRMTTLQKDAISNPAPGLMVFNTDTQELEIYTSGGWFIIKSSLPPAEFLLGGSVNEVATSICKTTDGGFITAGFSTSSGSGNVTGINNGSSDFWIVKQNASGTMLWNRLIGGNSADRANSIQQTSDGGYIVTGFSFSSLSGDIVVANHGGSDIWVVKLDATGNINWNKLLGGTGNETVYSIQQTSDGGYIVSGSSTSSVNGNVTGTNHGSMDSWIIKLDATGNITWSRLLGGVNDEEANSIQQTTDGGYIVSGYSSSSADGDVTATNHGGNDIWVMKLDASGNINWNKLLGGTANDAGNSIVQTSDGGYIIAGFTLSTSNGDVAANHGLSDLWIVKLNAAGTISWAKLYGGTNLEAANSIQQTSDGNYIVAGYTNSNNNGDITVPSHGMTDFWIMKLDAVGNIIWNKLLGGNGDDQAYQIQQLPNGKYIVAGHSASSANGDVTATNHGSLDFLIFRLDALGNIIR